MRWAERLNRVAVRVFFFLFWDEISVLLLKMFRLLVWVYWDEFTCCDVIATCERDWEAGVFRRRWSLREKNVCGTSPLSLCLPLLSISLILFFFLLSPPTHSSLLLRFIITHHSTLLHRPVRDLALPLFPFPASLVPFAFSKRRWYLCVRWEACGVGSAGCWYASPRPRLGW